MGFGEGGLGEWRCKRVRRGAGVGGVAWEHHQARLLTSVSSLFNFVVDVPDLYTSQTELGCVLNTLI